MGYPEDVSHSESRKKRDGTKMGGIGEVGVCIDSKRVPFIFLHYIAKRRKVQFPLLGKPLTYVEYGYLF